MITSTIYCPRCNHPEMIDAEDPLRMADVALFECSNGCGYRSAYGRPQLRHVFEPFVDNQGREWVRHRIQHPITNVDLFSYDTDPKGAALEAKNLLFLVLP